MLTDYRAALAKIDAAPLTLTDADFAALDEFNPADERRGRDAVRRAQLAAVAPHSKAHAPDDVATLVAAIEHVVTKAVTPLVRRVEALEVAADDARDLLKRIDVLERASADASPSAETLAAWMRE